MGKIISTKEAITIARKLKNGKKKIVVCGGCFDILHIGHIRFLKSAKKEGDVLFALIENDESVKKKKGNNRPINPQKDRLEIIASLEFVDFAVSLKEMTKDSDYDTLMAEILPDVIATTQDDQSLIHKERQAKKIGGSVKYVTKRIEHLSSSKFARILGI